MTDHRWSGDVAQPHWPGMSEALDLGPSTTLGATCRSLGAGGRGYEDGQELCLVSMETSQAGSQLGAGQLHPTGLAGSRCPYHLMRMERPAGTQAQLRTQVGLWALSLLVSIQKVQEEMFTTSF